MTLPPDFKDYVSITASVAAVFLVPFSAWKTWYEVRKLRNEQQRERANRIHVRQLEALSTLYEELERVLWYAQAMTRAGILEGEPVEQYPAEITKAVSAAQTTLIRNYLVLPSSIAQKIEDFLAKTVESQRALGLLKRNQINDPQERQNLWEKAGRIAHTDLPALQVAIKDAARDIIHNESAPVR